MTSHHPAAPRRPLATRRAALVGGASAGLGLVAVAVTGARTGGSGESSAALAADTTTSAADDDALVAAALAELTTLATLVASARRGSPVLREPLGPLLRLHRAHAAALDSPLTGSLVDGADQQGDPTRTWRTVRAREDRLQRRLVRWAVEADSGALARLLASMSAGLAQHLAVLGDPVPAGTEGAT